MLETNLIAMPMCDHRECDAAAVYEFTDIIMVNPKMKIGEREPKRIVLSKSCESHYEETRKKHGN